MNVYKKNGIYFTVIDGYGHYRYDRTERYQILREGMFEECDDAIQDCLYQEEDSPYLVKEEER